MLEVFNRCLKEGRFPRVWKKAAIAWIPKPVCLLPTIGKVYDKILATRLSYHLEVRGLLSDNNQFGFRKGRGTTGAIDRAVGILKRARAESKHAVLVALDIKNAFNSAWYPGLLQLLLCSGCPGNLGRDIADLLQDRSVTSEGVTVETSRGCPQGSCLGPSCGSSSWRIGSRRWTKPEPKKTKRTTSPSWCRRSRTTSSC
jgi:hypothetical protein